MSKIALVLLVLSFTAFYGLPAFAQEIWASPGLGSEQWRQPQPFYDYGPARPRYSTGNCVIIPVRGNY